MTPLRLLHTAIVPALTDLASGGVANTPDVRQMMLAIALQETRLEHRRQVTAGGEEDGPAMSFWQFERTGGCRGVLQHRASAPHMRWACEAYNVDATEHALWTAMQYNDIVAACAARLLLYTLPQAMATTAAEGWAQYLQAWRPGQPHPKTWAGHWATAERVVKGQP